MLYDIQVETMSGALKPLSEYEGKPILIVNTASKCGFTPQFEGLEEIYKEYKDKGLEILGFPCNQFLFQDPGSNEDIQEFCQLNYGVTFEMFSKIKVNGKGRSDLYKFLLDNQPDGGSSKIKWNFTKFLISKEGEVIKRFDPTVKPSEMIPDIEGAL
jgi:glutathione peroxidase